MKKILLVEDDPNLGGLLAEYLEAKGYDVKLAKDGEQGLNFFMAEEFEFCILDVMMPKKDGFTLAKDIRSNNQKVPLIFLTAKTMSEDMLRGFGAGADDYITKPFKMEELLARMEAIFRRVEPKQEMLNNEVITIGNYTFEPSKQLLKVNDTEHKLTTKEAKLLEIFCRNKNRSITRAYALKMVWGDDSYFNARSMDVYITKLRKYLKEDSSVEILNLHGEGFKILC